MERAASHYHQTIIYGVTTCLSHIQANISADSSIFDATVIIQAAQAWNVHGIIDKCFKVICWKD